MGYWLKRFSDGRELLGLESDPATSWSKSQLSNMSGARLHRSDYFIEISGMGEYWQSDTYESSMITGETLLIKSRLEKKVEPRELFYGVYARPDTTGVILNGMDCSLPTCSLTDKAGKWLIIERDFKKKNTHIYFSDQRI